MRLLGRTRACAPQTSCSARVGARAVRVVWVAHLEDQRLKRTSSQRTSSMSLLRGLSSEQTTRFENATVGVYEGVRTSNKLQRSRGRVCGAGGMDGAP
jgi:hypothetical protein